MALPIITTFFLQATSTLPVLASTDFWDYVFKIVSVAATLAVPLALGGLKLRDMVIENRRRIADNKEAQLELLNKIIKWEEKQEHKDKNILTLIHELENKREKDLIESRSMEGISAVIDTKVKLGLAALMKEISDQRHEDIMLYTNAISNMEKNFSNAMSQMKETLAGVNATVAAMGKEFERMRKTNNKEQD